MSGNVFYPPTRNSCYPPYPHPKRVLWGGVTTLNCIILGHHAPPARRRLELQPAPCRPRPALPAEAAATTTTTATAATTTTTTTAAATSTTDTTTNNDY